MAVLNTQAIDDCLMTYHPADIRRMTGDGGKATRLTYRHIIVSLNVVTHAAALTLTGSSDPNKVIQCSRLIMIEHCNLAQYTLLAAWLTINIINIDINNKYAIIKKAHVAG